MKTVNRTHILLAATLVWLAASTTLAAGPPRYGYTRVAANPQAASRVNSRMTSQATPPPANEPEQISAPPMEESPYTDGGGDPSMWEGMGDEGMYDDGSCSTGCRRGLWYFNIDYLLVKPRFSQGVAENRRTLQTSVNGTTTTSNLIDESINYCFRYDSSFRLGGGYRLLDCGGDVNFTYWRLTGNDHITDGPASTESDQLIIGGQLNNNPGDGQFFSARTGVTANIFDLDFSKCMSLGGPQAPCDCNFCPRWDLRWSAGVRGAKVTRFNDNVVSDSNGDQVSFGNIDSTFSGAGPKIGMQGRRYFGQCGTFSIYAKGSQALLIGNYKMSRVRSVTGGSETPTDVTTQIDQFCRMVPVTDIEIGGSWQVAPYAFVSIGWFWQCWWDLGQAENISGTNFGPLDSSNILGFDGLFVRGELLF